MTILRRLLRPRLLAALALAACGCANAPGDRGAPPAGRFQIVATENRAFILDSATGQAWEMFVSSGSGTTHSDFGAPKLGQKEGAK